MPDENEKALKHLYGVLLLERMATALKEVHPSFDIKAFCGLMPELKVLEMKPRVQRIRDELKRQLPSKYSSALKVLLASTKAQTISGFDLWPYTEFVQSYGLSEPKISLEALRQLTKLFTSEWGVRPFLRQDPVGTLNFLEACARDSNTHVRRWASEGTRPRLPWGERLHDFVRDPSFTEPILELLKFDEELYVRKSVANHLNDISKDHPDRVVKLLSRWKKQAGREHGAKIDWTIRRALRSLIKQGHSGALKLIGVSGEAKLTVSPIKLRRKTVQIGDYLEFEFEICSTSKQAQTLVVDYVVHFMKSNNTTAPKVFKLRSFKLAAGENLKLAKRHPCKKITTRRYHAGRHALEIQINGKRVGRSEWLLKL